MFIVIVGCGKVGVNTARSLLHLGHEVIVVEQRKSRYDLLLEELGDNIMLGDGTEIWVLEKAGIGRADLVVAVTGDDEDNIIISQIARLKYGAPKVVARVNNPFNQPTFDVLGIDATICAATNMLRLIMHELPAHKFVPLLTLKRENIEVIELEVGETSPLANRRISEITLPEGALLSAILRDGEALLPSQAVDIRPDDYLICLLQPGLEQELIHAALPEENPAQVQAEGDIDIHGGED
ncbi:MAG TPA: NAD-binding protein [Thermoleophilia bacterium]|nr:NAD-binding protein [Thermoleophilia bacterium]